MLITIPTTDSLSITLLQAVTNIKKKSLQRVLNVLVKHFYYWRSRRKQLTLSYEQIGREAGTSTRTVHRAVKELSALGFIAFQYRLTSSHIYTVATELYTYAPVFRKFIPSLWNISFKGVLSYIFGISQKPFQEPNVIAYKKSNYITPLYIVTPSKVSDNVSKDTRRFTKKREIRPKRGARYFKIFESIGDFMEIEKLKSTPTIDAIEKTLLLTKLGKAKLFAFDEKIICEVWNQIRVWKDVKNPFDLIMVRCIQLSQNRNIRIDWDIFYLILNRYNIVNDGIFLKKDIKKPDDLIKKDIATTIKGMDDKYKQKPAKNIFMDIILENMSESNPELYLQIQQENSDRRDLCESN